MDSRGALGRLWDRLCFLVGRGRISQVNDAGGVQVVQVPLSPVEVANLRRVAEFGLTSNPPVGTDAIVLFVAGDRANGVVIATNNLQLRPTGLQPGEVMIYDAIGQSVHLSKNGIVINGNGNPLTVNNAPQVVVNGAETVKVSASTDVEFDTPLLKTTGDILDNSGSNTVTLAQLRGDFNVHDHEVTNVQSGTSTITTSGPNPTA